MKLARIALGLMLVCSVWAVVAYGGDYVAQSTDSPWLAGMAGLVTSAVLTAAYFWIDRFLGSAVAVDVAAQDEKQAEPGYFVVMLSLALILILAAFGNTGTSSAFGGGAIIGCLILMAVQQRLFTKSSLQS